MTGEHTMRRRTALTLLATCGVSIAARLQAAPTRPVETAPQHLVDATEPAAGGTLREWRARHAAMIKRDWGVDIVGVKPVASGSMLALRYRILDPQKAALLNERKSKAYLIDEASGTVLAVPAMENIGELRSSTTPQLDRIYFMIFGNPGQLVKAGSKVSVIAGDFRIQGLVVE